MDPLDTYEQSQVRLETQEVSMQISREVRECYQRYGYDLVAVPSGSVAERLALIQSHIESD